MWETASITKAENRVGEGTGESFGLLLHLHVKHQNINEKKKETERKQREKMNEGNDARTKREMG